MHLTELLHWRDPAPRTAAAQMALDEALFTWSAGSGRASMRFYHWDGPALTTGYFLRTGATPPPGAIRRYTGGGLVEHGEDLTFSLSLPPGCGPALAPAAARYRWIHEALARALAAAGCPVALEAPGSAGSPGPCFARPVPWDLLDPESGVKIGGGAQRRSRGAVIHQGSLRLPEALRHPGSAWIDGFLSELAGRSEPLPAEVRECLLASGRAVERARYGNEAWNRGEGG